MDIIRKILTLFLTAIFIMPVSFAQDLMNTTGNISHEFKTSKLSENVYLKNSNDIVANEEIIIPKNSVLKLKTLCARKERRWHKSGFILTKLESFTTENSQIPYDVTNENIYLAVRKYEPVDKKEAAILATEIIVLTGASFYAPGVDVAYFFTKGAILRKKHPNWFRAGVSNAYDNSIFWFWLKGKPIELEENSQIKIQSVDEEKIEKLTSQVNKYNEKQEFKALKKQNKKLKKENKKAFKEEKNFNKNFEKEVKKAKIETAEGDFINYKKQQPQTEEQLSGKKQFKISKKQYKINRKNVKKLEKLQNQAEKDTQPSSYKKFEKRYFKALKNQVKQEKKDIKKLLKVHKNINKRFEKNKEND